MLVVVVVVDAMSQKGAYVDSMNAVLRYSETSEDGIQKTILLEDANVECGEEYITTIQIYKGPEGLDTVAEFETTIHEKRKAMTFPKNVTERNDELVPGRSIKMQFHDVEKVSNAEEETKSNEVAISDSADILGRGEAVGRKGDVDSSIYVGGAKEYLDKNGESKLLFRNTRNGKESVGESHSDYVEQSTRISFPYDVRQEIDVEPGDLIEVVKPGAESKDGGLSEERKDKIDQMYQMVCEMYGAYMNDKE